MAPGELLKVRIGGDMLWKLVLTQQKEAPRGGAANGPPQGKGRVVTKYWRLDETQTRQSFLPSFLAGT